MKSKIERFWSNVSIKEPLDCWDWQAGLRTQGYGSLYFSCKYTMSHIVSWTITKGEVPKGLCVLHKCDNKKCVNPAHLFLGTRADNRRDMCKKGRDRYSHKIGELNPRSIFTEANVIDIRSRYKRGVKTQRMLSIEYKVNRGTIKDLLRGRTWGHLPGAISNTKKGHPSKEEMLKSL